MKCIALVTALVYLPLLAIEELSADAQVIEFVLEKAVSEEQTLEELVLEEPSLEERATVGVHVSSTPDRAAVTAEKNAATNKALVDTAQNSVANSYIPPTSSLQPNLQPSQQLINSAPMVVTHEGPASPQDKRYEYDRAVLRLALEATRETHGDYILQQAGNISFGRLLQQTKAGKMPNTFIKTTYEKLLEKKYDVDYVPFPVDLGITGYRVCFLSGDFKDHVAANHSLADIKSYSIGQGSNWADTDILIHNGFRVKKIARYDYLFAMTKARRFDLFCRGANEVKTEFETHQDGKNFALDESFVIKYPFPRYYYTHKSNTAARIRILEGLVKSYNNGSLKKLWEAFYGDSVIFSNLHKRVVYEIENPLIKTLAPQYFDFYKKVEADTWQYILDNQE